MQKENENKTKKEEDENKAQADKVVTAVFHTIDLSRYKYLVLT